MNPKLSDRVNEMATSATLAMAAKARSLKEEGVSIIGLSLGEPDFTVPEFVKEAAIKAIEDDYHAYSPVDGYAELKKAIALKFKRDNNLSYALVQIVVSTGAKQSLANLAQVLLNPGDEVIVTNQDHEANISPWTRLKKNGVNIIEWKFNLNDHELKISDLEKLISSKTKIIAVTHCSNIVGSVNDLKQIADLSHAVGALIIGDGVSFAPHGFPDVKAIDVDFYTFSLYKTYGPHLALLYGKKNVLKKLPNQNHEFLEGQFPYTINPGGPNHEELV